MADAIDKLSGKRLAGGEVSREAFARLLGVDGLPPPVGVRSVGWIEHHVEVELQIDDERTVVFSIERAAEGSMGLVATPQLNAYFRGGDLPPEVAEAVQQHAPERLAGLSIEDLGGVLAADPRLGGAGLALPPDVNAQLRPANQLDTWGAPDAYADFFAGGEISRGQLDSIDPTRLFQFIQHSDSECHQVNPHGIVPIVALVDYPWDARVRRLGAPAEPGDAVGGGGGPDDADGDSMVTTDLDEQDVVLGNPQKLRDVLEYVTAGAKGSDRILFCSNTCVPTVIGEDVESVVREFQRKSPVPLLYLTVTPKSMTSVFDSLLVEKRLAAEAAAASPDPRAVNLVGFPDERATSEVVDLLRGVDVRVNTQLLPSLDVTRVEALPGAALNVFLSNQLWQHLYDQVRFKSRVPGIAPLAPYGFEGTRRWLRAIVEALELPVDLDAAWRAATAGLETERREMARRIAGRRLGLIVRAEETFYLTDPSRTWGIPLIEVLEEAGFGLDVFLLVRDRAEARKAAAAVNERFADPSRHRLTGFNSPELLYRKLAASECAAVFSHHVFDWRVTQAAKGRFTLAWFEMGLAGLQRTLLRLAGLAETPFYRTYARYLQRTPAGLRQAPGGPAA